MDVTLNKYCEKFDRDKEDLLEHTFNQNENYFVPHIEGVQSDRPFGTKFRQKGRTVYTRNRLTTWEQ